MTAARVTDTIVAGRYRVLRALGAGAHGVVDLAEDLLNGGRWVALKRLEGIVGASDPEPASAVLRWLRHPRWAEVLDEGRLDTHGRFQTLRYIPGRGLDQAALPLPPDEVFRFLEDGARVLGALHALGLLHYDVTPGNFVREERPEGVAFTLTDGGLAHIGPVRGIARGTPLYMAPEVVEGTPHDQRADIYSLGLVAFRLATGTDAFPGGAGEALGRRRREEAPSIRSVRPDLPDALARVIAALLRRSAAERPADASAVLDLLAAEGRPSAAQPLPGEQETVVGGGRLIGRAEPMERFRRACQSLLAEAPARAPGDEAFSSADQPPAPDLLLLLQGTSGTGVTRLAREMAAVARDVGVNVLALSGREGTADRRGALRRLSDALAALTPEDDTYRATAALARGAEAIGDEDVDPRLVERFVALCERVSAKVPVALLVEDFRELPAGTRAALRVLGRHLFSRAEHPDGRRAPRLLLVVDCGPESVDDFLIPDAADARRPCIEVPALTPDEIAEFLRDRLPSFEPTPADVKAVHEASEGLPRGIVALIGEGVRRGELRREAGRWAWATDGVPGYRIPSALEPALLRALADCTRGERAALEALALLEVPVPDALLARVAGPDATNLARSPLVRVSHEGDRVRMALASRSLRAHLLAEAGPTAAAGRRLVAVLDAEPDPDYAPECARLWLDDGRPAEAMAALERACGSRPAIRRRAVTVLAAALKAEPALLSQASDRLVAARLLVPGLEARPVADALLAALPTPLAEHDVEPACLLASHLYANRQYDKVVELAGRDTLATCSAKSQQHLPSLRVLRARGTAAAGATTEARSALIGALRALRRVPPALRNAIPATFADYQLSRARLAINANAVPAALRHAARAQAYARRARDGNLLAQAYNVAAIGHSVTGAHEAAASTLQRALRLRSHAGDVSGSIGYLYNLGRLRETQGMPMEAAALYARALSLGTRFAHHEVCALSLSRLAEIYDRQRNARMAVATLLRARQVAAAAGNTTAYIGASRQAAILLALIGDMERSRSILAEATRLARKRDRAAARTRHSEARSIVYALQGQAETACSTLLTAAKSGPESARPEFVSAAHLLGVLSGHRIRLPKVQAEARSAARATRNTLARIVRSGRRGAAETVCALLAQPSESGRDTPPLSSLIVRCLYEVALRLHSTLRAQARLGTVVLDRLVKIGQEQQFRLLQARALAVRALVEIRSGSLSEASHSFTAALAAIAGNARQEDAQRPALLVSPVPQEFTALRAEVLRHVVALSTPRQPDSGGWTEMHALAHLLTLHSGAQVHPDTRIQRALRTILSISARLDAGAGLEALLESLNAGACEITKAERTCVVLTSSDGNREVLISNVAARKSGPSFLRASRTVIQRVLASRSPLLLHDVYGDAELMERPSIVSLSLRSVMCVPLLRGDRVYGAMYADSASGAGSFDAVDLEVLSLFAEQASAAIETSRLLADLQRSCHEVKATQERLLRGERLRVIGEMTSGVAHEFNNLLTAILARLQLMKLDLLPSPVQDGLDLIEKATLDAAGIVRRLQGFARAQRQTQYQAVDLAAVCADAVELLRPLWSSRRIAPRPAIQVRMHVEPGLVVSGSAPELREVVTNLLKNAIEALDAGGHIEIGAYRRQGRCVVEVGDDGPGIPEEYRSKLFTPFFTTKGERGTGLGLCLSQQIVERHGGELRILSSPRGGTTAVFELPEVGGAVLESQRREQPPSTPRPTILVVDDDPQVLDPLCHYLERNGYQVRRAQSGADALKEMRTAGADVVVTDIAMPGMNGLELCRRLHEENAHTPVILMTGHASDTDPGAITRAGAAGLLAKPFTMRQMAELLAAVAAGGGNNGQNRSGGSN